MAAARRRQELEKPPHMGPVHAWEVKETFRSSTSADQAISNSQGQVPGSWLKQWTKTQTLAKGISGYSIPHKHLIPAPAIWSQGTGPMRVFQAPQTGPTQVVQGPPLRASEIPQDDMDEDDAMLFESLLNGPSIEVNQDPLQDPQSLQAFTRDQNVNMDTHINPLGL